MSTWKHHVAPTGGHERAINPDMYKGVFAGLPDAMERYANDVHDVIRYNTTGTIAGFIAEPI